jgi:hypothetical protein
MPVANYSSEPFAPGSDPSVSIVASLGSASCCELALRAASINAASSIQPWNGLEAPLPFDSRPLIGSESMSTASITCAVPLFMVRNIPDVFAFRTRQAPQD